jgi:hypothetical protein
MSKRRAYWGCEMSSPLYRQVVREMAAKRMENDVVNKLVFKKRGKRVECK